MKENERKGKKTLNLTLSDSDVLYRKYSSLFVLSTARLLLWKKYVSHVDYVYSDRTQRIENSKYHLVLDCQQGRRLTSGPDLWSAPLARANGTDQGVVLRYKRRWGQNAFGRALGVESLRIL